MEFKIQDHLDIPSEQTLSAMKIIDRDGLQITVTDLDKAIRQAGQFMTYRHDPPQPLADARQQAYWTDLYKKLLTLKQHQPATKKH
ncbi:MAG: hypothetical protein P0Y53_01395 [Candidatus Pseudobacter hemicellulosilyticus]|uniref:3-isopropylmalate dehydratase n=1 Tax=Candidatus Pseudobacter hemicellulosilyticus TaxID=3121375 RepID=A0AAJ6BHC7_9BACT|nr:MAG: hypothetical protein P0Y53_01395 [Pseudobacter sp.]